MAQWHNGAFTAYQSPKTHGTMHGTMMAQWHNAWHNEPQTAPMIHRGIHHCAICAICATLCHMCHAMPYVPYVPWNKKNTSIYNKNICHTYIHIYIYIKRERERERVVYTLPPSLSHWEQFFYLPMVVFFDTGQNFRRSQRLPQQNIIIDVPAYR